jgi:two-component system, LuxR family, sensor kinase FixL
MENGLANLRVLRRELAPGLGRSLAAGRLFLPRWISRTGASPGDIDRGRIQQYLVWGSLVFLGYFFGSKLGFALTFHPHPVSVLWPPNSILLAAFLLTPVRAWWFLLLSALPAHLIVQFQSGVPLSMVLSWFISNSFEALIGAAGVRYFMSSIRLDSIRNVVVFFLCGALLGPFLSSFLDAAFVALNQWGEQNYWQVWRMRFFANVFAALTLVPAVVSWSTISPGSLRRISLRRFGEAGLLAAGLLAVCSLVFYRQQTGPAAIPSLLYVPLPFLLWAAVRFRSFGVSQAILSVAFIAIFGAVNGRGPFASLSPEANALSIQIFFTVVALTLMFLAATIAERSNAEERFTRAFRSSPDAMIITRLCDGHIIEVNDRYEKMLGYHREEIVGRTVSELNIYRSESDRERVVTGTAEGCSLRDLQLCFNTKRGGSCVAVVSADTAQIGGERCLLVSLRDITEHKRAEEAQQNLAHAYRLAVLGEFSAMIAHEVNQPLGAILSNAEAAEMLLDSPHPPLDEIRQILSDIRQNDLRADAAIRCIRALLRKREIKMESLDLNETIVEVLRLVAGDALRRRVQIHRQLAAEIPQVRGDRIHLQQVLLNLILNGMDAMSATPESNRRLTIQTQLDGAGQARVAVSDLGHGIPSDALDRVFESFYTTKREGMGLGLSIARSIIEVHEGRIWTENNAGGGATFCFTVKPA